MSFFERAKAAATDLAAKADTAMGNAGLMGGTPGMPGAPGAGPAAGPADRALRDYGLLVWREQNGGAVDAAVKERVVGALREMEAAGQLAPLQVALGASAPAGGPPPPPGAAAAAAGPPPPPGAASAAPSAAEPSAPQSAPPPPPPGSAPPPPPSWAT